MDQKQNKRLKQYQHRLKKKVWIKNVFNANLYIFVLSILCVIDFLCLEAVNDEVHPQAEQTPEKHSPQIGKSLLSFQNLL